MLKFATSTTSVRYGDRIVRLAEGDPWYADDEFVVAQPDLFSDMPSRVYGVKGVTVAPVEQATARPGEKRRVKP